MARRCLRSTPGPPAKRLRRFDGSSDAPSTWPRSTRPIMRWSIIPTIQRCSTSQCWRWHAPAPRTRPTNDCGVRACSIVPTSLPVALAEDVLALEARIAKDRALAAAPDDRADLAKVAARHYEDVFGRFQRTYTGINAATMWCVAADLPQSHRLADEVLALLDADATAQSTTTGRRPRGPRRCCCWAMPTAPRERCGRHTTWEQTWPAARRRAGSWH